MKLTVSDRSPDRRTDGQTNGQTKWAIEERATLLKIQLHQPVAKHCYFITPLFVDVGLPLGAEDLARLPYLPAPNVTHDEMQHFLEIGEAIGQKQKDKLRNTRNANALLKYETKTLV